MARERRDASDYFAEDGIFNGRLTHGWKHDLCLSWVSCPWYGSLNCQQCQAVLPPECPALGQQGHAMRVQRDGKWYDVCEVCTLACPCRKGG